MARGNQKRDSIGRFADEGKGDFSDAALVARSRKRIERWKADLQVARIKYDQRVRELDAKISVEVARLESLL